MPTLAPSCFLTPPARNACAGNKPISSLAPRHPTESTIQNSPIKNIMKHILLIAFAFLFVACGPDKARLRTELQSIEAEMVQLRIAAEQQRAQMDQAEF